MNLFIYQYIHLSIYLCHSISIVNQSQFSSLEDLVREGKLAQRSALDTLRDQVGIKDVMWCVLCPCRMDIKVNIRILIGFVCVT